MRRLFIIAALAGVVALAVLSATAQPGPGRNGGQHSQRRGRRTPRWTRNFEERLEEDIQWLRDNGLEEYADRLVQLRQPPGTPEKRQALIDAARKVRTLRFLHEARPKQAQGAIEALRLELSIERLAEQWRAADRAGDTVQRRQIGLKLRPALEKQFDARLQSTRAVITAITKRLEKHQRNLKDQEQFRGRLIDERFKQLTRPGPSPEPAAGAAEEN